MPTLVLEDIGPLAKADRTAPSRLGAIDPRQPVATEKNELQYARTEASATTEDSPAPPFVAARLKP